MTARSGTLDRRLLSAYIDSIYQREQLIAPDGTAFPLIPRGVLQHEGEVLRDLAIHAGAARTIETGLCFGLSTLFLCEALVASGRSDACHVAIDPFQRGELREVGLRALDNGGVSDLVEFHDRMSQLVLPELLAAGRRFDLAFVDGDHRFDGVFVDLFYLHRLVKPGGLIVVDDVWMPSVRTAVKYFITNVGLELVTSAALGPPSGEHTPSWWSRVTRTSRPRMCVLRCPETLPERPWWGHFVPFADADSGLMRSHAVVQAEKQVQRGVNRARPLLRWVRGS